MKIISAIALGTYAMILASCMTPQQAASSQEVLGTVVRVIDKDGDGVVTNTEAKGAPNDPMTWIAGILGLLGILGGGAAAAGNKKTAKEVDELWDKTIAKA